MKTIPIEGFEHRYKICENGDVISDRFGLAMSPSILAGYPKVNLWNGKRYETHYIHRLLARHFIPNPDNLNIVNHKNGDTEDFRLENLQWVSESENVKDGFSRGRIHPQLGKRYVDRDKVCEGCRETFQYVKPKQRFCGKRCAGYNNLFDIKTLKLHDEGLL